MEFKDLLSEYQEEPLTRQVILSLLKNYKRPNDKISELIKARWLIGLKNGLYVPGPKSKLLLPESLLIANHLWGPSYVSMESALSFWGLIPERVFETTSMTVKPTKTFKTELGRFSYKRTSLPYYSFGIRTVDVTPKQAVMIASPEKAICDKIVMTSRLNLRSIKQAMGFLTEDIRIDEDIIRGLKVDVIETWISDAPKQNSLLMLIKTIRNL
ncbi:MULTISPECIES: hypothetical protein [unclassified Algoriphagus]|jgi:predicted transcriptional regulator of viral defense system|uniref:type IV toxin-antitoxin system AbiEi family antitoxin domain-containing protein n=1 Tax=unclassified Algoriphagus TaxID=2641541 RepID=UPI001F2A3A6A|nr:hypothetical protein [Algoriphagus sp. AGSA1]MCE7053940.1 hypothetical protein [Algoriphagus sp. AGSA1]